MNHKKIFKTAMLAGEIMLRNGAETYRVEDTIQRILKTSGCTICDSFVTPTGIFATLDDPTIDNITLICRVNNRTTHLHKIALTNNVSRAYVSGKISIDEAYESLVSIKNDPPYPDWLMIIAFSLSSGFFSVLFNGNFYDFITASLVGFLLGIFHTHFTKYDISSFIIDLMGGIVIGICSIILTEFIPIGSNINAIIIGSIMPLVPGLAITNAVRDTIQGDLVSGISRGIEAIFIAVSLAAGVGISFNLYLAIVGGTIPWKF